MVVEDYLTKGSVTKMVIDTAATAASFTPLLTAVGFGGIIGYLIGVAIRFIIKIIAVIAGLFLIALVYLQSQGILNVNWTKLQTVSKPVLLTIVNYLNSTNTTTPTIHATIHNNLPFLPLDMGLPFIGSAGLGFMLGLTRR
jgi:uncharacterized membrane protein (Fun14 family)